MPKAKSYMNPNIPKPKPGDSKGEGRVTKPMEPRPQRPGPLTPRAPGKPGRKRPGPLTPRTPVSPDKREKRPLPKPINKSGLKKDGPSGKKGSLPFNPKKPILLRPIKKSGDMGARSRNQRSPRLRGGR